MITDTEYERLIRPVIDTWDEYRNLFPKKHLPGDRYRQALFPIPFFGRLDEAEIITVGLNPSSRECERNRNLRDAMQASPVRAFSEYFHRNPHPWFRVWTDALQPIGGSYHGDRTFLAAHIDLSPRPLVGVTTLREYKKKVPERYGHVLETLDNLLAHDIRHVLTQCLALARRARVLLIAGTATADRYIPEVLQDMEGMVHLDPPYRREAASTMHALTMAQPNRSWPCVLSTTGPSARNKLEAKSRLRGLVEQHRESLLQTLNDQAE